MTGMPYSLPPDTYDGYVYCRHLPRTPLRIPIHSAIHDIECFFWVTVYECLVRSGPGGAYRPEVMSDFPQSSSESMTPRERKDLTMCIHTLFHTDDNGDRKATLFLSPDLFESSVLPFFHPYFTRMKPLVREWWYLLQCLYRAHDDVTQGLVHEKILGLLNEHLERVQAGEGGGGDGAPGAVETSENIMREGRTEAEWRRRDVELGRLAVGIVWDDPDPEDSEDPEDNEDNDDDDDDDDGGNVDISMTEGTQYSESIMEANGWAESELEKWTRDEEEEEEEDGEKQKKKKTRRVEA
ncbi:hypothetical protein EUX98_g6254 [Antrodiella citrinella]|uniref:Fungal-type protein kinase domain-containing protein n=1 Tax=Antrodiella citrinella TaxID=2447956 RepID=A0A4S4MWZ7_9APHY|nr:hypothetical protein EUX98_g6254 [Antrodiella citrinella]